MSNVDVLVIVDVDGALGSGLGNNVYLVDTNKYVGVGSSLEGQSELHTACVDGDTITWHVAPVSPSSQIEITAFTGQMVDDKQCTPQKFTDLNGPFWQGRVESQGVASTQQYSVTMKAPGSPPMSFDPFLVISNP
jgi:hypothetical protein